LTQAPKLTPKLTSAQQAIVKLVAEGKSFHEAREIVNIKVSTSEKYLGQWWFRDALKQALEESRQEIPSPGWGVEAFIEFRRRFFDHETTPQQLDWVTHFFECDKQLHIVLGPPESGKTSLFGVELPAYLFAYEHHLVSAGKPYEPTRIVHVGASVEAASDVGWQLKRALTDNEDLIATYGPFKARDREEGGEWSSRGAYMAWRDAEQKDPSVQWIGPKTRTQGKRTTLFVMDDVDNAQATLADRKQIVRNLKRIYIQRLGSEGKLWFFANRQDEADIASWLLAEAAQDGAWCVHVQQALVDGKSFWPERFSTEYLEEKRKQLGDREFNLVYQQIPSSGSDAPFGTDALESSLKRTLGWKDYRDVRIVSFDPAPEGPWAGICASASRTGD
jgi:hypothetical protein